MADFPLCRYCKKPYTLARETTDFWEMCCEDCKVGHVFSKPASKAAGRYRAQLQQKLDTEKMVKQWESRPKHFYFDGTKTGGVN